MTHLADDVTHVVSYWYIPGGYDYVNAEVRTRVAHSEEEANALAESIGLMPPEMATVMTREQYILCKEQVAKEKKEQSDAYH